MPRDLRTFFRVSTISRVTAPPRAGWKPDSAELTTRRRTRLIPVSDSVHGGTGIAHHLAPFFVFGADERAELLRVHGRGIDAGGAEALLQLRILQGHGGFGVNAVDDFRRRSGRCGEAEPERRLETRDAGFGHGRNIGKLAPSLRRGGRH